MRAFVPTASARSLPPLICGMEWRTGPSRFDLPADQVDQRGARALVRNDVEGDLERLLQLRMAMWLVVPVPEFPMVTCRDWRGRVQHRP